MEVKEAIRTTSVVAYFVFSCTVRHCLESRSTKLRKSVSLKVKIHTSVIVAAVVTKWVLEGDVIVLV